MHLSVGYLSTPTGDDGVALASALAATFDATADIVLVVHHALPDGHAGRAQYQQMLVKRGEEWVSKAAGDARRERREGQRPGHCRRVLRGSLIDFAEQKSSDLIVVGGARDGMFGGHVIGSVAGSLLHCSPIRRGPAADDHRGHRRGAHPPRRRQPVAVRDHPGQCRELPIRTLSLVSAENLAKAEVSRSSANCR